jgi:hypothetical protein
MDGAAARNPADLPLVTFDANALFALRGNELAIPAVREILEMNRAGLITVSVTVSTSMEAKREEELLEGQYLFAWIESLGIARENIFTHPLPLAFSVPAFPDGPTFHPGLDVGIAYRIKQILHPNYAFTWPEHRDHECKRLDLTEAEKRALRALDDLEWGPLDAHARLMPALEALSSSEVQRLDQTRKDLHRKWVNATCDSEGLRIHISQAQRRTHPEHAVFVTSDGDFHKPTKRQKLCELHYPGEILRPAKAVEFLRGVTGQPASWAFTQ